METGFFVMEDTTRLLTMHISDAKMYCWDKVDNFVKEHPQTRQVNIDKAKRMIHSARTSQQLAIDVSNFILAHTSENLAVI